MVAANKIIVEWLAPMNIYLINQKELDVKNRQLLMYSQALEVSCSVDSLNQVAISKYRTMDSLNANSIKQLIKDLTYQKLKMIPVYIAIPVGCVLSFLLGYYVHR